MVIVFGRISGTVILNNVPPEAGISVSLRIGRFARGSAVMPVSSKLFRRINAVFRPCVPCFGVSLPEFIFQLINTVGIIIIHIMDDMGGAAGVITS